MSKLDQLRAMREASPSSGADRVPHTRKPKFTQPLIAPSLAAASEASKRKTGRPRIGEEGKTLEAIKPWVSLKMSRGTWFRRQAEKRAKAKQ
jgi:hypothetical protein